MPLPILSNAQRLEASRASPTHWALGDEIDSLPRIFEDDINIAVMRRTLARQLEESIHAQCLTERAWQLAWLGKPEQDLRTDLLRRLPDPEAADALVEDIQLLAEAMCYLFDASMVGIRLRLLDAAMCPRFHCDNLPVRLITTYLGPGSEWLPEGAVNRTGLGAPHEEKPEALLDPGAIQQLRAGDIALFKGGGWVGNEDKGIVHRSPALNNGQRRLLLTMDPA